MHGGFIFGTGTADFTLNLPSGDYITVYTSTGNGGIFCLTNTGTTTITAGSLSASSITARTNGGFGYVSSK